MSEGPISPWQRPDNFSVMRHQELVEGINQAPITPVGDGQEVYRTPMGQSVIKRTPPPSLPPSYQSFQVHELVDDDLHVVRGYPYIEGTEDVDDSEGILIYQVDLPVVDETILCVKPDNGSGYTYQPPTPEGEEAPDSIPVEWVQLIGRQIRQLEVTTENEPGEVTATCKRVGALGPGIIVLLRNAHVDGDPLYVSRADPAMDDTQPEWIEVGFPVVEDVSNKGKLVQIAGDTENLYVTDYATAHG